MGLNLTEYCRFQFRWLVRNYFIVASLMAVALAAIIIMLGICLEERGKLVSSIQEWRELKGQLRTANWGPGAAKSNMPELTGFNSIALINALHSVADYAKLPLDEISYSLEDNGNQPYLCYRATLTVSSNYPAIRRFIDRVREDLSNVALDGITCAREDIGVKELSCDLTLSAFYRKG